MAKNKRWTEKEIEFLKENYSTMPIKEISLSLKKSKNSVYHKKSRLELIVRKYVFIKKRKKWTPEEIEFLKENTNRLMNKDIAVKLGRTKGSIADAHRRFKIKKIRYKDKDKGRKSKQRYYQKNKEYFKEYMRNYNQIPKNQKHKRESRKKYCVKPESRLKQKISRKIYNQKPEIKKQKNEYMKNKKRIDKNFNISSRLRCVINYAFKKYTKTGKIMSSRKYKIDYGAIINHLKPFPRDLSTYHIDHIKPLCSFEFINKDGSTNLKEIQKAFAPKNHQWLTIQENLSKGGRF